MVKNNAAITQSSYRFHVMTYIKNSSLLLRCNLTHLIDAFVLKFNISNSKNLIHNQYFSIKMCRNRKS